MSGSMFVAPGQSTWDLTDMKIVDGTWDNDTLSLLLSTAPVIDSSNVYYYYSASEAEDPSEVGWWRTGSEEDVFVEPGDVTLPIGKGFLAKFYSSTAKLVYAGEVITGNASGNIEITKPEGQVYRFIVNPLPYDVDLTDVELANGSWDNDNVMFLLPNVAVVDSNSSYYYYSASEAEDPSEVGWWRIGTVEDEFVEAGDVVLKAGVGILTRFYSTNPKLIFKAPNL